MFRSFTPACKAGAAPGACGLTTEIAPFVHLSYNRKLEQDGEIVLSGRHYLGGVVIQMVSLRKYVLACCDYRIALVQGC